MYKYGVDLVLSGHVHNQERSWPVHNHTVVPSDNPDDPYEDARAPVYVNSGNPGNAEATSVFSAWQPWSVWRSYHFGSASPSLTQILPSKPTLTPTLTLLTPNLSGTPI